MVKESREKSREVRRTQTLPAQVRSGLLGELLYNSERWVEPREAGLGHRRSREARRGNGIREVRRGQGRSRELEEVKGGQKRSKEGMKGQGRLRNMKEVLE